MQGKSTSESRRMIPVEGHAGIYKRGNRYVVKFGYRGRERKKSFRTLTEAKSFKAKAAAGEARPSAATSFKAYALEWLKSYTGRTAKGVSDGTRESYADAITRVAIPYFGTMRLDHIDAPKVRAYIAHVAAMKTRNGKGEFHED